MTMTTSLFDNEPTRKMNKKQRQTSNGIVAPKSGKGLTVWQTCTAIARRNKAAPALGEVLRETTGISPITVNMYYRRWRRFYSVTGFIPDPLRK